MSLLMDALKKADETIDLPTLPNTSDIVTNKDEEPLSLDIINDDTPTTSPSEPTSDESFPIDWDNELLVEQFDDSSASDEKLHSEEQNEKVSTTHNWDDELLPQFREDKKPESLPSNESDEIAPLNDNINIDSDKAAVLDGGENELKKEVLETTQTSVETPKQTVANPGGVELQFKSNVTELKTELQAEPKVDEKKVDEKKVNENKANEKNEFSKPVAKPAHYPKEAQRILAASAPPTSSKRTLWLSGVLAVLLIGMGAGYYYIESLSSPSQFSPRRTFDTTVPRRQAPRSDTRALQPAPEKQPFVVQTYEQPVQKLPDSVEINKPAQTQKSSTTQSAEDRKAKMQANSPVQPQPKTSQFAISEKSKSPKAPPQTGITTPAQKFPPSKKVVEFKQKPSSPTQNPGIKTLHKTVASKINIELSKAYAAFQQGDHQTAQIAYTKTLQQDQNNRDALLGLAALALFKGNKYLAQQHYRQVLQLYPQDTYAQVGLINTLEYLSPETESQLKLLLEQSPQSAYIHFNLGNLYASQKRWAQAQQAYFNALHYDINQANYAYNLAISLDHLNQPQMALTYYKRALQLAPNQPIHFNSQTVLKRVQTLIAHTDSSALARLPIRE